LLYTSTLDVQTIWERSFRRANLGLQYSQGFHPQPRIQIANPLPLGFIGRKELVDIWLTEDIPLEEICRRLPEYLPNGLGFSSITSLPENAPSLPKQIEFSDYRVYLYNQNWQTSEIEKLTAILLENDAIPRVRNHKAYDLRPLIHTLTVSKSTAGFIEIFLRMPSNPAKTGRPEEVLFEMGFQIEDFRVERLNLVFYEQPS